MLTRFFGLLSSEVGDVENVHVLVMENLFPPQFKMKERYDMKGSWVGRRTKMDKPNRESSVLKDLDFNRKLNLTQDQKMEIRGVLQRDVSFLCFHKSMDYSILLGIHKIDYDITPAEEIDDWTQRHGVYLSYDKTELYFIGVIDVLTVYNIRKKLERFFKVYIMLQDGVR
jgi:1-phosphatidylinositol-4-phosphate 5-kinase